jgi:nucleotide-binding universal stress UspA family protein
MKAAIVRAFGEPLVIEERPDPQPGPGQVRVRVEASGLCHTDIHAAVGVCVVVGVGEQGADSAALRFAVREAGLRHASLDAVRAWRCPAHESTDHALLAGEPARLHEQHAAEFLDAALKETPADVDLHRLTVEGPAPRVLLNASHEAGLLVIGARRNQGHLGRRLGRVAPAVLHHGACAVAVVPEGRRERSSTARRPTV